MEKTEFVTPVDTINFENYSPELENVFSEYFDCKTAVLKWSINPVLTKSSIFSFGIELEALTLEMLVSGLTMVASGQEDSGGTKTGLKNHEIDYEETITEKIKVQDFEINFELENFKFSADFAPIAVEIDFKTKKIIVNF